MPNVHRTFLFIIYSNLIQTCFFLTLIDLITSEWSEDILTFSKKYNFLLFIPVPILEFCDS